MAVKNKDKEATVSVVTRTITADNVSIENGLFVDEQGNIADRVSELLINTDDKIKVTIKFELPDSEQRVGGHYNRLTQIGKRNKF